MKSQSDLPGGCYLRGKEIAAITWKNVVVVGRCGASGQSQAR
jgi:hypothetical protein